MIKFFCIILLAVFSTPVLATNLIKTHPQTISTHSISNFQANPPRVKKAIELALTLAGRNIGYKYGSADPNAGGMDCSGTIYYLLTKLGLTAVPRSSDGMYQWVKNKGHFYATNSHDLQNHSFLHLKPGDLLFWSGTYPAPGNSYATHVMMYVGKNTQGQPLMVGASDGRTYKGKQIYGVSIFDFNLPPSGSKSKFLGYSCIPQD